MRRGRLAGLAGLAALAACAPAQTAPTFHAAVDPPVLSAWGLFAREGAALRPAAGTTPYDVATPLYSDYAQKLRTIAVPKGAPAKQKGDAFDLPVGTILTKTFYYPVDAGGLLQKAPDLGPEAAASGLDLSKVQLVETRLLVRRQAGWSALAYVWDEDEREARLARAGALLALSIASGQGAQQDFAYLVPNKNQCASCHAADAKGREVVPIGLKPRHLDMPDRFGPGAQLDRLAQAGVLTPPAPGPRNAVWSDPEASVAARARAYLDANCGHCHRADGPAAASALFLDADAEAGPHLGLCKPPIAAGRGAGGRAVSIAPGDPEGSILVYRMLSQDPGAMMPELGRALVHEEGVALISAWIAGLPGACRSG